VIIGDRKSATGLPPGPIGRPEEAGRALDVQSTSRACRPAYQPQLPHTTWGCFTALQRGQTLRDGALSVQLEARRLRPLALEVFFLGTAIVVSTSAGRRLWRWALLEFGATSDSTLVSRADQLRQGAPGRSL